MLTPEQLAQKRGGTIVTFRGNKKSTWRCAEGHTFNLTINKVRKGKWCSSCGASVGERMIRDFFRIYQIPFVDQAVLPGVPNRRYDFYFEWLGKRYIVEYDGEQHFHYVRKYHRKKGQLATSQAVDRVKTYLALTLGCCVIRIDYSQREAINNHLTIAVNSGIQLYLSTPLLYRHLTAVQVTPEEIAAYR